MVRVLSISFAATCSLLLLASASAGHAAQGSAGYLATPAKAPAKTSFIVRDRLWKCDTAGACAGPKSTGNQNTACALAAQRLGTLTAFHVEGQPFDEAALAKCNERAS
jgi:hypothetical protein